MNKRIISIVLAIMMCFSVYIPAAAAGTPAIAASYSSGAVNVTGTGFAAGTGYMVRIVNTSQANITAMSQVLSDAGGNISAAVTTGALSPANQYAVYVNAADGTRIASDAVSFPPGSGSGNGGGNGDGNGGGSEDPFQTRFKDVLPASWYYEAVKYVVEAGLMKGTGSNTFEPNKSMTRAMFVTVLYRLAGEPSVSGNEKFTDVVSGSWYEDAVNWGSKNGVVKGTGENKFDPGTPVTREQMAAFMHRYADLAGLDANTTGESGAISGYKDSGKVSYWALEAMIWSVEKGLIVGMGNNKLEPQGTATRAQVATILMRYVEDLM